MLYSQSRPLGFLVLLLLLSTLLWGVAPAQQATAIRNALIIDGNGGPPLRDGVILIRGRHIEAIGRTAEVAIPGEARVIDAAGKAVLPGLADMHVHLLGGWDGISVDMLGYPRYLNALLYAGVTTILDTGNVLPYIQQIRQEIQSGHLDGPQIYFVGPVVDGPDPVWPPISYSVTSASQIPNYIQQLKRAGVNAVKGYTGLSVRLMQSLVREAKKESLGIIVDQGSRNGSPDLIRVGVKTFAHLPTLPIPDETVQLIVEQGVSFITTLAVYESFSRRRFSHLDFLDHPLLHNVMPPWFVEDLLRFANREVGADGRAASERATARLRSAQLNLKRLFDAGVPSAAGTDSPYPGVFFGEGLHRELELLVEAGLTPLQAITAATRNAAQLMGAGGEWGTLEVGKLANILVVAGNPAEQISDTRKLEVVIRAGRILDRKVLEFDLSKDPGYRVGTSVSSQ